MPAATPPAAASPTPTRPLPAPGTPPGPYPGPGGYPAVAPYPGLATTGFAAPPPVRRSMRQASTARATMPTGHTHPGRPDEAGGSSIREGGATGRAGAR